MIDRITGLPDVPVAQIMLKDGTAILVDIEDAHELRRYHWCKKINSHWSKHQHALILYTYIVRSVRIPETGKQRFVPMHRQIMGAQEGQMVVLLDGDFYNHRRGNLFMGTPAETRAALVGRHRAERIRRFTDKLQKMRVITGGNE